MFFSKRAIEDHIADWVEDRFAILLEHFSAEKSVRATQLVLPHDQPQGGAAVRLRIRVGIEINTKVSVGVQVQV